MNIVVNGQARAVESGATVLDLLDSLGFQPEGTVVERNADILERVRFGETVLAEGDTLEVIRFVGGG